jgi:hypothetical protein
LEYHYFDPAAGAYRSARTEPIALTVEGGPTPTFTPVPPTATPAPVDTPAPAALALPTAEPAADPAAALTGTQAILGAAGNPLPAPAVLPRRGALAASPWYWALWLGPLAAVLLGVGAARRERNAARRQAERQQARAGADALRSLAAQRPARDAASDPIAAGEAVARAQRVLSDYLSRKLGRRIDGLTRAARAVALQERGVPPPLVARVQECYAMAELARFSPAGVEPSLAVQMQRAVQAVVRDLERVL